MNKALYTEDDNLLTYLAKMNDLKSAKKLLDCDDDFDINIKMKEEKPL